VRHRDVVGRRHAPDPTEAADPSITGILFGFPS